MESIMLRNGRKRRNGYVGRRVVRYACAAMMTVAVAQLATAQPAQTAPRCKSAGPVIALPELNEASGLAVSRSVPGRLWTLNDSGQPIVFALDTHGKVTARVRVTGVSVEDWEAIAVGPCPAGSCLYIADIGDNAASRPRITIYRVPETATDPVAVTDLFHATYPDGAHDAETLLLTPDGELFIVTKGGPGGGAIYRFPRDLKPGSTHRLERVGEPRPADKSAKSGRAANITDGAVSTDGTWVALRTGQRVAFYRSAELFKGGWREEGAVDLTSLHEAQGEGVAFASDASLYLAGEGGGKSRPGSFAHLTCSGN
jgi:hypothetical protein